MGSWFIKDSGQTTDIKRNALLCANATGNKQDVYRKTDSGAVILDEVIYPEPRQATAGMTDEERAVFLAKMDAPLTDEEALDVNKDYL